MKLVLLSLAAACALADGMGSPMIKFTLDQPSDNFSMGGAALLEGGEQQVGGECGTMECEPPVEKSVEEGSEKVQEGSWTGGNMIKTMVEGSQKEVSGSSSSFQGSQGSSSGASGSSTQFSQSSGSEVLSIPNIDRSQLLQSAHVGTDSNIKTFISSEGGSSSQVEGSVIKPQLLTSTSGDRASATSAQIKLIAEPPQIKVISSGPTVSGASEGSSNQALIKVSQGSSKQVNEQKQLIKTCESVVPETKDKEIKDVSSEEQPKRTCGTPVPTDDKGGQVIMTTKPLWINKDEPKPTTKPLLIMTRPSTSSTESSSSSTETSQVTSHVITRPVQPSSTTVSHSSQSVSNHQVTTTVHPVVYSQPETKKTTTTTTVQSVVHHPPVQPPPQKHEVTENEETTITTTTRRIPIPSKPKPKPKPVEEEHIIEEYYVSVDENGNEERLEGHPRLIGGNTANPFSKPNNKIGLARPPSDRYGNLQYVDESNIEVNSELFEGEYLPVMYSLKTHKLWPYSFKFSANPVELPRTHLNVASSGKSLDQLNMKNSKSVRQVKELLEEERQVEEKKRQKLARRRSQVGSTTSSSTTKTSSSVSEGRPVGHKKDVSFETIIIDGDSEEQEKVVGKVQGKQHAGNPNKSLRTEVVSGQVEEGNRKGILIKTHSGKGGQVSTKDLIREVVVEGGSGRSVVESSGVSKGSDGGSVSESIQTFVQSSDGGSSKVSNESSGEQSRVVSSGHSSGSGRVVTSSSSSSSFGQSFGGHGGSTSTRSGGNRGIGGAAIKLASSGSSGHAIEESECDGSGC